MRIQPKYSQMAIGQPPYPPRQILPLRSSPNLPREVKLVRVKVSAPSVLTELGTSRASFNRNTNKGSGQITYPLFILFNINQELGTSDLLTFLARSKGEDISIVGYTANILPFLLAVDTVPWTAFTS